METTPSLANCPKASSRNTRGSPVMASMIRKGRRKAPENTTKILNNSEIETL